MFYGGGITFIASILSWSIWTPSEVIMWPIYFNLRYLNWTLSEFSFILSLSNLSNNLMIFKSWSWIASSKLLPFPYTKISSTNTFTPSRSYSASIIRRWNSSLADDIPNGILSQRKRPNGVLKVVRKLLSSVNFTYQYPFLASKLENIYA